MEGVLKIRVCLLLAASVVFFCPAYSAEITDPADAGNESIDVGFDPVEDGILDITLTDTGVILHAQDQTRYTICAPSHIRTLTPY